MAGEINGKRAMRQSRRRFLRGAGGALVGFSAVNFLVRRSYGQDEMTKELVLYNYGGSFGDAVRTALVEPFEKETGVKVYLSVLGTNPEMYAKLRAATMGGQDSEIDLFWNDITFAYPAVTQELVQPLRLENIPSYAKTIAVFNKLQNPLPWDPGEGVHGAPVEIVPRNMGYNPKVVSGPIDSLTSLWDQAHKEHLGIYANTQWMIANACFLLGQDPNAISDIEAVWEKLREQKPAVKRYFENWSEGMELYQNGTIALSPLVGGRVTHLRQKGMEITYLRPKEGALINADLQMIPRGAKNRRTAEAFIEFTYREDIATKLSELLGYPLAMSTVRQTDVVKALPDYDPTNKYDQYTFPDPAYWIDNLSVWTEKVREILAA